MTHSSPFPPIAVKRSVLPELQEMAEKKVKELQELKLQLEVCQTEVDDKQGRKDAAEKELEVAQDNKQSLEKELVDIRNKFREVAPEYSNYLKEKETLESKFAECLSCKENLEQKEKEVDKLAERRDNKIRLYDDARKALKEKEQTLENKKEEIQTKEKEVEVLSRINHSPAHDQQTIVVSDTPSTFRPRSFPLPADSASSGSSASSASDVDRLLSEELDRQNLLDIPVNHNASFHAAATAGGSSVSGPAMRREPFAGGLGSDESDRKPAAVDTRRWIHRDGSGASSPGHNTAPADGRPVSDTETFYPDAEPTATSEPTQAAAAADFPPHVGGVASFRSSDPQLAAAAAPKFGDAAPLLGGGDQQPTMAPRVGNEEQNGTAASQFGSDGSPPGETNATTEPTKAATAADFPHPHVCDVASLHSSEPQLAAADAAPLLGGGDQQPTMARRGGNEEQNGSDGSPPGEPSATTEPTKAAAAAEFSHSHVGDVASFHSSEPQLAAAEAPKIGHAVAAPLLGGCDQQPTMALQGGSGDQNETAVPQLGGDASQLGAAPSVGANNANANVAVEAADPQLGGDGLQPGAVPAVGANNTSVAAAETFIRDRGAVADDDSDLARRRRNEEGDGGAAGDGGENVFAEGSDEDDDDGEGGFLTGDDDVDAGENTDLAQRNDEGNGGAAAGDGGENVFAEGSGGEENEDFPDADNDAADGGNNGAIRNADPQVGGNNDDDDNSHNIPQGYKEKSCYICEETVQIADHLSLPRNSRFVNNSTAGESSRERNTISKLRQSPPRAFRQGDIV